MMITKYTSNKNQISSRIFISDKFEKVRLILLSLSNSLRRQLNDFIFGVSLFWFIGCSIIDVYAVPKHPLSS